MRAGSFDFRLQSLLTRSASQCPIHSALRTSAEIRGEARTKEDTKAAVEAERLATGHRRRRQRAVREFDTLMEFLAGGVRDFRPNDAVGLGALVDVSLDPADGEAAQEERTLFVLPVVAGAELTGPGGDGFVFVVTPSSPVGKALLGSRPGDIVEVVIAGEDREWELVDVC